MNEELKNKIIELAKRSHPRIDDYDNYVVDDYAGGNVDDAFENGSRYGEVCLAQHICDKLGWEY